MTVNFRRRAVFWQQAGMARNIAAHTVTALVVVPVAEVDVVAAVWASVWPVGPS